MQLFFRPNSSAVLRSSPSGEEHDLASSAYQDMWMTQDVNDDDDNFGGDDGNTCECLLPSLLTASSSFVVSVNF